MKRGVLAAMLVAGAVLATAMPSRAQFQRHDSMWARSTDGAPLTLDGVLDEPVWAQAESVVVRYPVIGPIPGSGYKDEGGFPATDRTWATFRFLTVGNQLWMSAVVRDSSIGGSDLFNRFDGLLMSIKQHDASYRPAPAGEHLISWWWPAESGDPAPTAVGKAPSMIGRWRSWPPGTPPDASQLQAWDARVTVNGIVNSDTLADAGYVVEMRCDLGVNGYDVTVPGGDIVEWNVSVYDIDWYWPLSNFFRFSVNRTWLQGPWGNTGWYHNVKIHARPDVTVASATLPSFGPDLVIPSAGVHPSPVIDGQLSETVWQQAPSFDIRFDDSALRDSYPATLKFRSGQYQPPVNGGQAFVADGGDATVRYFFKNDSVFFGIDVRDAAVQYHANVDRWDGGILTLTDRVRRHLDNNLKTWRLSFQVSPAGTLTGRDDFPYVRDSLQAIRGALALKPGTTVDTLGLDIDTGYTVEFAVDLTRLGYPSGLGDRALYWGYTLLDGDSFIPFTDSYATRTWFGREYEGQDGPCVAYMSPTNYVTGVGDGPAPAGYALLGAYPNPLTRTTSLRYTLASAARVQLDVFDLQGRKIASQALGFQQPGRQEARLSRFASAAGVYLYRLHITDPVTGAERSTLSGKLMLLQ